MSVPFNSPKIKPIIRTVEGKLPLNAATKLIFILIEEENGSRPSSLSTIAASESLRPSFISFWITVSAVGDFDLMGPSLFLYSLAVFTKQTSAHLAGSLSAFFFRPLLLTEAPHSLYLQSLATSVSSSPYPLPAPLSSCSFPVAPLLGFPGTVHTTVFSSPLCSFFSHCELAFLSPLKPASPWALGTSKMVAFSVLCPLDPTCGDVPDCSYLST